jgi:hypothetical protein
MHKKHVPNFMVKSFFLTNVSKTLILIATYTSQLSHFIFHPGADVSTCILISRSLFLHFVDNEVGAVFEHFWPKME